MDSFYTPPKLALALVQACSIAQPRCIADFAAGDGALLKAASAKWPTAELCAMDLDGEALQALSVGLPRATLLKQDFLEFYDDLSDHTTDFPEQKCYDLVLLNPPFTCRGSVVFQTSINGHEVRSSRAMAFVARALSFVRTGGELVAIVPSSCLTSQKDREVRGHLARKWRVEVITQSKSCAFTRCAVKVNVVKFTRLEAQPPILTAKASRYSSVPPIPVRLLRGTLSVKDAHRTPGELDFIHTSDLQGGRVVGATMRVALKPRLVTGPAILLPRVGNPRRDKVVLMQSRKPVVISDCLFALQAETRADNAAVLAALGREWDALCELYTGSCARYLTLDDLSSFLAQRGFEPIRAQTFTSTILRPDFGSHVASEVRDRLTTLAH